MSKRKDRERAERGLIWREGKLVDKAAFEGGSRLAEEKALVEAEKSHGDLVAVNRWLKKKKESEEQARANISDVFNMRKGLPEVIAITADPEPENKPYYCSKCKRTHIGGMKYDNHKEFVVRVAAVGS